MESNHEASSSTDTYKDCQEEGAHAYVACDLYHSYLLTWSCSNSARDVLSFLTATNEVADSEIDGQDANTNSTSDEVFLSPSAYGSPGNLIDDCGVVEIDLVSTEVATEVPSATEYETAGSPKLASEEEQHYDMYENGTYTGEFVMDYDEPTDGEHDIIIEENKAIELAKLMQQAQAQGQLYVDRKGSEKRTRGVRVSFPPPNQIQILAASLTGKKIDSFQSGNIKVTRKPNSYSDTQL